MFNKELAHEVSVNGAIIFGQLCSSHESFGSKDMLTTYQEKEYFFLTSEVIEEETALTYKQQLKAIKDLEAAGYIQTVIMGSPAKKYFHITDKVFEQFKVSSDKKEDLNEDNEQENSELEPSDEFFSYDQRETQAVTKEQSKPLPFSQAYKENKEKEKGKNNKFNYNCNYKKSMTSEKFRVLLTDACNELYTKLSIGRYSKKQWNTLIEKFVNDSIERKYYQTVSINKLKGFAFKCLEKITDNTDYKYSGDFAQYKEIMTELSSKPVSNNKFEGLFYNWLEAE